MDLTEQAKLLRHEPKFKAMLLEAARRLLQTRGVVMIVDKEKPISPDDLPTPV